MDQGKMNFTAGHLLDMYTCRHAHVQHMHALSTHSYPHTCISKYKTRDCVLYVHVLHRPRPRAQIVSTRRHQGGAGLRRRRRATPTTCWRCKACQIHGRPKLWASCPARALTQEGKRVTQWAARNEPLKQYTEALPVYHLWHEERRTEPSCLDPERFFAFPSRPFEVGSSARVFRHCFGSPCIR